MWYDVVDCGVMRRLESGQDLHPWVDGKSSAEPFFGLLDDIMHSIARGRRRVELLQVQAELFKRGWHP
jgi:hypothetical protein